MRFLLLFLPLALWAQSYLISTIPLPKTYIQNLDPYPCNIDCMQQLVANEQIFSFLAYAQDRVDDPALNELRLIHISLLNLGSVRQDDKLRIALLLPHRVIGRYAFSTTNTVFSYMLTKNRAFEIKSFQVESESYEDLSQAFQTIESEAFYYVIAPVTQGGANTISAINPELNIFFPTINKNDINTTSESFYYGGIDYRAQIDALLAEAKTSLVIFYDKSRLGQDLEGYTKEEYAKLLSMEENATAMAMLDENGSLVLNDEQNDEEPLMDEEGFDEVLTPEEAAQKAYEERPKTVLSYAIEKTTSNLEKELNENREIQFANFFLNTPIIKSSMVLSQLTLFDVNVSGILSTQISYDPLILSMTQYKDREQMLIANSISSNNNVLIETNALLSNDIVYDWINYATTLGTDFFYHLITRDEREYQLPMVNNQIQYPINLVRPSFSRFIPYARRVEEPLVEETDE